MVSASIRASPNSIWATIDILDTGSGYNIICHPALFVALWRQVCPDYEIFWVGNANLNSLQILSAVILSNQFYSAVYKTVFLIAVYFSAEVLIGTWFVSCLVKTVRGINQKVEFTKGKIPPLESTPNDVTEKRIGIY